MSINAVKGVEIGEGFAAAALSGEANADEMRMHDGLVQFASNHAGGILGGISTGQPIVARFAVKPTSSILTPRADGRSARRRRSRSAPKAATIRASASAPCRWARRCWPACWPIICCAIARRTRMRRRSRGCRGIRLHIDPDRSLCLSDPPSLILAREPESEALRNYVLTVARARSPIAAPSGLEAMQNPCSSRTIPLQCVAAAGEKILYRRR